MAEGGDPKHTAQEKPTFTPTFGRVAEEFWEDNQARWRNARVRAQWLPFMARHCKAIWNTPISAIDNQAVLLVIRPLWNSRHYSARRCLHRIGQVVKYGKFMGWRSGENPAEYRGNLDNACPRPANLNIRHHSALPFAQLPALMARLAALPGTTPLALRMAILTACRVGEVFGATWAEIDMDAQLWRIPATRYKTKKEHVVPLSAAAIAVLAACPRFEGNPYCFPSPTKAGAPLSSMAIIVLLKRMGLRTTAHGTARSTFSDWAHDFTDTSHEVIEECLGHQTGNAVSRAYRRGQALDKRRVLLELWADRIVPRAAQPLKVAAQ
jgi:integrase